MSNFLTLAGLLGAFCLASYGWGWAASRFLYSDSRLSPAYLAALGLSIWVAIGGILNAAQLAYPIVLDLILALGLASISVYFLRRVRRDRSGCTESLEQESPEERESGMGDILKLVPYLLIISATTFHAAVLLPADAFNHHDDFYKYLPRIVQMLHTGSLGGNPFSWVGTDSLGAQAFLQGFFVAHLPLVYVNSFDAVLCFLASGWLLSDLGRRLGSHWLLTSLVVMLFIFFNPQYVNISALYSGALMILALVYSSILFFETGQKKSSGDLARASIALAFFAAALANLKQTFVPFAAIYLLLFFLLSVFSLTPKRNVLFSALTATVFALLSLFPWVWVFWDKYLNAIEMAENILSVMLSAVLNTMQTAIMATAHAAASIGAQADESSFLSELFSYRRLFYGGNTLDYNFLFFGIVLATAYSLFYSLKEPKARRGILLVAVAAGLASIASYLINAGFAAHLQAGVRYSTSMLISVFAALTLICANHSLYQKEASDIVAKRSQTLGILVLAGLCVPLGMFADQWWERSKKAFNNSSLLAYPISNNYLRYQRNVLGDEGQWRARSMQEYTEPGATIWAWISTPFHLDFQRNRVLYASSSGRVFRRAQVAIDDGGKWLNDTLESAGVDYILWENKGAPKEEGDNEKLAKALVKLMEKGQVIKDERGRVLFKPPT